MVFSDVEYQHKRKGGCYGRVTDPNVMAKMYEDMANYIGEWCKRTLLLRNAKAWREKADGQA
jgi:hypothetical protein